MAGGSDSDRKNPTSKARRWVLRSPGRKPTTKAGDRDQAKTAANRALSPPHDRSTSPREQEQQTGAQHQEASPLSDSSQGWNPRPDSQKTRGAPRADECLATTDDAGGASAGRFIPQAGALQSRSRSPLSRIRNKMPVPSAGLIKRFRRRSPNKAGGSSKTTEVHEPRSPKGRTTASCSIDTTSQDAELACHSGGGGESAAKGALASPVEDDGRLGVLLSEPCTAATDETQSSLSHHTTYDAGCRGNDELLEGGVRSATPLEREASRDHPSPGVGQHEVSAVKAGKQPPRVAFIGVFLNGVAVALASYAPFGGVDARIALVRSLLLEPNAVVRPGGRYTVRGSALAVHIVVDQKHRAYACITAEDVPFSVGLSLLEEVQIEYISAVATLAFSTKENSHNTRCHAQMARSWAKYETVERALARERETRRLLGEDPLDIESPAGSSRTYTGAEATPLHFTAQHQPVLLAASREIFSLEENGGDAVAVDAVNSDDSDAGVRLGKLGQKKKKAALLVTGVTGLVAGLYTARDIIFSF